MESEDRDRMEKFTLDRTEKRPRRRQKETEQRTGIACPMCGVGTLVVHNTKDFPSRATPGVVLRYRYRKCTACTYRPAPTQERIGG